MSDNPQKKFYENRLRELAQWGFVRRYENEINMNEPSEALIEQCAPPTECLVRDLGDQGVLYLVWLSVAAKRPGVSLYDFCFRPPWPDGGFQTLPTTESCRGEAYVLPNKWEFPRKDVLNLRFQKSGWRLLSTPVEGWLFAHSLTAIPEEYKYGAPIEVRVEMFGKAGRRLADTVTTMRVDRSTELGKESERSKAARAELREQRWQKFLRTLTPEEAEGLGVHVDAESALSESDRAAKSAEELINRDNCRSGLFE